MLKDLEIVRTYNPYSLSIEELAGRQIAANNRQRINGGIMYIRKNNKEQSNKNLARGRIVSLFKKKRWPHGLSILTMPGLNWIFEQRLLAVREGQWERKIRPSRITHICSVEIDPAIYALAAGIIPRQPNTPIVHYTHSPMWTARSVGSDVIRRFHNCDVFQLMKHNQKEFDAAWLDFTGPLTEQRMEQIVTFYNCWVRSIFIITFLGARQSADTSLSIEEQGGMYEWLSDNLLGISLHAIRYTDGSSTMVQYAVAKPTSGYVYNVT